MCKGVTQKYYKILSADNSLRKTNHLRQFVPLCYLLSPSFLYSYPLTWVLHVSSTRFSLLLYLTRSISNNLQFCFCMFLNFKKREKTVHYSTSSFFSPWDYVPAVYYPWWWTQLTFTQSHYCTGLHYGNMIQCRHLFPSDGHCSQSFLLQRVWLWASLHMSPGTHVHEFL